MKYCPQCGGENRLDARFCTRCGARLQEEPSLQPSAPAHGPGEELSAQTLPPTSREGGPPAQAAPTTPGSAYVASPPPAPTPPHTAQVSPPWPVSQTPVPHGTAGISYRAAARKRKPVFWVGAGMLLLSGLFILISSFMPWLGSFGFSFSGMDMVTEEYVMENPFFDTNIFYDYGEELYPMFSGLTSIILGLLMAVLGTVALASRRRWPAGLALPFSIIALGIAVTNLSSILRYSASSAGAGLYAFALFSLVGIVGSGMCLGG